MGSRRARVRRRPQPPPVVSAGPSCLVVRVTRSPEGELRSGPCGASCPPGMVVCGGCADRLLDELAHVPGLALALEAAHGKQLRFGVSRPTPPASSLGGEDQEEAPLPFDPRASAAAAVLLDTLTRWADLVARSRGLFRSLNTWTALPAWLCGQVSWLRSWDRGPEAVAKLRGAVRVARLVVDRPPDLVYVGPCSGSVLDDAGLLHECGADLYARPGRDVSEVSCRECGATFPIGDRRAWLLEQAEDRLLPATELARAIDGLGVDVTPERIRQWKARGQVVEHGLDRHGHPVYRVGDIMDLVDAAAVRAAAKEGAHRA